MSRSRRLSKNSIIPSPKEFGENNPHNPMKVPRKKGGKKKKQQLASGCVCVSCGHKSRRTTYALRMRAGGVRCEQCGGNVVESRFAPVSTKRKRK
jgi:hypothetical protein